MDHPIVFGGLAILLLIASVPVALLVHRALRQAKLSEMLRIDTAHGVAEEGFVSIGGIDQWISIRGEDRANPALLVLHGGPGSSYSIFTPHLRSWEKHFTIVQWDQRGAGRTFKRNGPRASGDLSMDQLTRDAIELVEYLRLRLHQRRLFLLASSIGSTFGLQAARLRPDLLYAYIGTDQNIGMVKERDKIHRELLDRLQRQGMKRGIKAVERIGADPKLWTQDDFSTVTRWTMKSDPAGFRRTMKLLKDAVWHAPGWSLRDIRAFVKGMHFSLERLLPDMVRYDAWAQGTGFDLPIFVFQGENDVLTSTAQAQEFFAAIEAPLKHMELISDAGHFAAFMQPEQFLQKLLTHVRPLANVPQSSVGDRATGNAVTTSAL